MNCFHALLATYLQTKIMTKWFSFIVRGNGEGAMLVMPATNAVSERSFSALCRENMAKKYHAADQTKLLYDPPYS